MRTDKRHKDSVVGDVAVKQAAYIVLLVISRHFSAITRTGPGSEKHA